MVVQSRGSRDCDWFRGVARSGTVNTQGRITRATWGSPAARACIERVNPAVFKIVRTFLTRGTFSRRKDLLHLFVCRLRQSIGEKGGSMGKKRPAWLGVFREAKR